MHHHWEQFHCIHGALLAVYIVTAVVLDCCLAIDTLSGCDTIINSMAEVIEYASSDLVWQK